MPVALHRAIPVRPPRRPWQARRPARGPEPEWRRCGDRSFRRRSGLPRPGSARSRPPSRLGPCHAQCFIGLTAFGRGQGPARLGQHLLQQSGQVLERGLLLDRRGNVRAHASRATGTHRASGSLNEARWEDSTAILVVVIPSIIPLPRQRRTARDRRGAAAGHTAGEAIRRAGAGAPRQGRLVIVFRSAGDQPHRSRRVSSEASHGVEEAVIEPEGPDTAEALDGLPRMD